MEKIKEVRRQSSAVDVLVRSGLGDRRQTDIASAVSLRHLGFEQALTAHVLSWAMRGKLQDVTD